ncbi:unnamed protein product [Heligmosomoides polygyrus]|uniref:Acyl-CoA_dh_N domain-containing protein n=1 Tax=Heligmosomoides polygyrus TaxID=6339 RepID=A0A183GLJ3_HELPZ|nr:unnamed protein product [Heligmosomoides polygyrus]
MTLADKVQCDLLRSGVGGDTLSNGVIYSSSFPSTSGATRDQEEEGKKDEEAGKELYPLRDLVVSPYLYPGIGAAQMISAVIVDRVWLSKHSEHSNM